MNYKWILFFVLFSDCLHVFGQRDTTQIYVKEFIVEDTIRKLWIGLEGGLEYCDRSFKTSDRYYASRTNFTNVDKRIPGSSFHMGLSLYYTLNHSLKLETGLHFLNNTYSLAKYHQPFLTKSVATGNDSILYKNIGFDYYQAYLYLPLHLKHIVYENAHYIFYASAGTGVLLLLMDGDRNDYTNMYTPYQLTYNPLTITWQAGLGVFYKVAPDLLIKLEPSCRSTITSPLRGPDSGSLFNGIISFGIIYTR